MMKRKAWFMFIKDKKFIEERFINQLSSNLSLLREFLIFVEVKHRCYKKETAS